MLKQLSRRNWRVLALLLAGSLAAGSVAFTLSVLAGGLIVIFCYHRLQQSLMQLVDEPTQRLAKKTLWKNIGRLLVLAALIAAILASGKLDPIGLTVGLSVVVINILWTTGSRALFNQETKEP